MGTRIVTVLGRLLLAGASVGAMAGCEAGKCTTGEACSKTCPAGQAGLCVARGICECVVGGGGAGGGGDGGVIDTNCRAVQPGELLINEVMTDGEGRDEDSEFVELVNLANEAVNLDGVRLLEVGDDRAKITFQASCLPARGVAALFRTPEASVFHPQATLVYDLGGASFSFPNSTDYQLVLQGPQGDLFDQFAIPTALVASGISVNRSPDFMGPDIVGHDTFGAPASPGRCVNGGTFDTGCMPGNVGGGDGGVVDGGFPVCDPPQPGALVINEVLVDGAEGGSAESDEFVELVNLSAGPVDLAGVTVAKEGDAPSITFEGGCLPGRGAVAVRKGGNDAWIFAPVPSPRPVGTSSLRLTNSADNTLVLVDRAGVELSRLTVPQAVVKQGVSANRTPDLSGAIVARHEDLFGGIPQSPALCPDGINSYADGCAAPGGDMGPPADGGVDGGDGDMGVGPDLGPPPCDGPGAGDLVLNELLVNGNQGGSSETDEFVELVNTTDRAIGLDGLVITAQKDAAAPEAYATFRGGCLPPRGAAAVRRTVETTEWFPVPDVPPMHEAAGTRLTNGDPWTFRLMDGEATLNTLAVDDGLYADGISATRVPDLTGEAIQRHDAAYPGTMSSPARCPAGGRYSAGCPE